jgi:V/A-type H+-transporting ATPase subunit I
MKHTLIIGAKHDVEHTIELLHSLEVVHIIDYHPLEKEDDVQLGSPTGKASGMSQQLLKLRSSAQILSIDSVNISSAFQVSEEQVRKDIDLRIQDLELSVLSLSEDKKRIEDHIRKIDERVSQLTPFADMDIPLESYQGFEHIVVFTGYVRDLRRLEDSLGVLTDEYELFRAYDKGQLVALFIAKHFAEEALKLLTECGYSEVKLPEGKGLPREFLEKWTVQRRELAEKLEQTNVSLLEFRKRYMEFILSSEEYLSLEVQKAEAPVRFATTAHSFIVDCWIPSHNLAHVKEVLTKEMNGSLFIEEFEAKHEEEPPTLLENPKPVRRFEFLLDMYSMPNYRDIDPSFFLALIFPLFFGLMIGDLGYGMLLILVGFIFMKKFKESEGLSNIGWYIIIAGVFSSVFGLLLFGDMFGLPFQSVAAEGGSGAYSWSMLLGFHVPIPSLIHKMESLGLSELLVISIIAGALHLGLGLLLGVISERKHNLRHAVAKIGLLCVLAALVLLIFVMADWTIGQWLKPLKDTAVAPMLWGYLIPAVKAGVLFGSLVIPYVTIVLGVIGMVIILAATGGFGLIGVLEVTSHLISYTRLAAICVAKGAMAFAFNMIGLGLILSGNIMLGVVGVILIVIMQLIVFALGSLSAGIQAVRLHYVEFFMKFYKGNGVKFTPFRYRRKFTTKEKEVRHVWQ